MSLQTLLLCIALTVLPYINGHTPEYFASIGQPMGIQGLPTSPIQLPIPMSTMSQPMSPFIGPIPMSPMGQPISPLGETMSPFGGPIPMDTMGQPLTPLGQPPSPLGGMISSMSQPMSNQYGRIWCTCRRRCSYREWTIRYTCVFPFYPRSWNTCCKYLNNYQTSSMSRGSEVPTFPQYPPTYPGMGILPPK